VPGLDQRVFGEHDLEAAKLGALHRQAGFEDEDALEVTRVLGQGMARYAPHLQRVLRMDAITHEPAAMLDCTLRLVAWRRATRRSRRCAPASRPDRRCTAGATGSARRSTSRAA
jgi:hypothetical protein